MTAEQVRALKAMLSMLLMTARCYGRSKECGLTAMSEVADGIQTVRDYVDGVTEEGRGDA
jgi:hypothetical protein